MTYRSEIDGLRALAVISVVIFHFYPEKFPLGYLGVDIFFVISGYLITTHLIERDTDKYFFYLKSFYSKRIKRLFPALFVFLFVSTVCISFFFLRPDFKSYFDSLIATKTLWANIFFWRDGGYFGGNDQLKPLLHMWSLSVEEQFYIAYPSFIFALIMITRKVKNGVILGIFAATLMSFMLWLYLNFIGGTTPAFFLMPTRAWQFGLGGIFAYFHFNNLFCKYTHNIAPIYLSAVLIIIGYLIPISQVINTVLVTVAAVFFLFSLNNVNYIFKFFSSKAAVFFGRISYSVYLYHWLISVVLLYVFVEKPPVLLSSIGVLFSFILGWISYKFIEIPFRYKLPLSYTYCLITILTILSLILSLAVIKNLTYSEVDKLAKNSGTHYRCSIKQFVPFGGSRACEIGGVAGEPEVILLGNSHAQMYTPIVNEILLESNKSGYLIPLNGCLPTTGVNISKACINMAKANLNSIISDRRIKIVIVASTWYSEVYLDDEGNKINSSGISQAFFELIDKLHENGLNVALISPIKIPNSDLASKLPRLIKFGHMDKNELNNSLRSPRSDYDNKFSSINNLFDQKLSGNYIETYLDLCDDVFCYYGSNYEMYFADGSHLSKNILKNLVFTKKKLHKIISNESSFK